MMADVIHMRNEQLEEDRLPDDDGSFNCARIRGSKDIDNLVPQSKYINRPFKENGDWYNMEQDWQKL